MILKNKLLKKWKSLEQYDKIHYGILLSKFNFDRETKINTINELVKMRKIRRLNTILEIILVSFNLILLVLVCST